MNKMPKEIRILDASDIIGRLQAENAQLKAQKDDILDWIICWKLDLFACLTKGGIFDTIPDVLISMDTLLDDPDTWQNDWSEPTGIVVMDNRLNRLAAYEATGLSPEEVVNMFVEAENRSFEHERTQIENAHLRAKLARIKKEVIGE